jgi:DNA-binding response OmpR family regulator
MDNTILIVEDDPQLQEVLALNLQNAGYRSSRRARSARPRRLLQTTCRR